VSDTRRFPISVMLAVPHAATAVACWLVGDKSPLQRFARSADMRCVVQDRAT